VHGAPVSCLLWPAVLPIMLASKLLPEQDEQQTKQLQDLQQMQATSAGRQQAAYVQVHAARVDVSLLRVFDYSLRYSLFQYQLPVKGLTV